MYYTILPDGRIQSFFEASCASWCAPSCTWLALNALAERIGARFADGRFLVNSSCHEGRGRCICARQTQSIFFAGCLDKCPQTMTFTQVVLRNPSHTGLRGNTCSRLSDVPRTKERITSTSSRQIFNDVTVFSEVDRVSLKVFYGIHCTRRGSLQSPLHQTQFSTVAISLAIFLVHPSICGLLSCRSYGLFRKKPRGTRTCHVQRGLFQIW